MSSSAPRGVVGLIGMGLLGSALAENLGRTRYTVRGSDIVPDRMREHAERGGVLLLAGVAAEMSERDNSSIISVLRSRVE